MSLIKEWIEGFLADHRQRFHPHDWPEAGSEEEFDFRRLWFDAFMKLEPKARREEAEEASRRLGPSPPRFRNDHLPAVLREIAIVRRESGTASAQDRKAAEAASKDCDLCGGSGMATVYHRRYEGNPVIEIDGRRVAARVVAHCICPAGRFLRSHSERDVLERIPDLQRLSPDNPTWTIDDPTAVELGGELAEASDWRGLVERLANRMNAAGKEAGHGARSRR